MLFPPLNLKKQGYICPITHIKHARYFANVKIGNSTPETLKNDIIIWAKKTAKTPFTKSIIKVHAASFFPKVRKTFVNPALPLPIFLMSFPDLKIFVTIIDALTPPIKYDSTAIKIKGNQ